MSLDGFGVIGPAPTASERNVRRANLATSGTPQNRYHLETAVVLCPLRRGGGLMRDDGIPCRGIGLALAISILAGIALLIIWIVGRGGL